VFLPLTCLARPTDQRHPPGSAATPSLL